VKYSGYLRPEFVFGEDAREDDEAEEIDFSGQSGPKEKAPFLAKAGP
jgi:hypothetical protein